MKVIRTIYLEIQTINDDREALEIANAMMTACKEIAGPTLRAWHQRWETTESE